MAYINYYDPEYLWKSSSFTNQDLSPPPSPPIHEHDPFSFFQLSPPFLDYDPFQDLSNPFLSPHDHHPHSPPVVLPQHQTKPPTIKPSKSRTMRKDHHGKIHTMHGLRDRRMRLSLEVARKFFSLQDMLGFDKASKTLDWLLTKSHSAIKDLMESSSSLSSSSSSSKCNNASKDIVITNIGDHGKSTKRAKVSSLKPPLQRSTLRSVRTKESRARARARAKERIKEKQSSSMQCCGNDQDGEMMKLSEEMQSVFDNEESSMLFNGTMLECFPFNDLLEGKELQMTF